MTRSVENKMEKKSYTVFPDHLDVQPIPSIISFLKLHSTLAGCFAIFGSRLACLEGSS